MCRESAGKQHCQIPRVWMFSGKDQPNNWEEIQACTTYWYESCMIIKINDGTASLHLILVNPSVEENIKASFIGERCCHPY